MGRRSLAGLTEHAGIKCGTPSTFPETLMKFVIGVALIVIAAGMVLLARRRVSAVSENIYRRSALHPDRLDRHGHGHRADDRKLANLIRDPED